MFYYNFFFRAVGTTAFSKVNIYYSNYVDYYYVTVFISFFIYNLYLLRYLKI